MMKIMVVALPDEDLPGVRILPCRMILTTYEVLRIKHSASGKKTAGR